MQSSWAARGTRCADVYRRGQRQVLEEAVETLHEMLGGGDDENDD